MPARLTGLLVAAASLLATLPSGGERRELHPEGGGVRVLVRKQGFLSAFAHDHELEVTRWRGTAALPGDDPSRAALELVLDAGSLQERAHGLSPADRARVEAQVAGPGILDAEAEPEITYRAEGADLEPPADGGTVRGTLHGALTLRGRTRPLDAAFEAERRDDGWHVRGRARFRQSSFGIAPFRGLGGALGVKDEVEVAFELAIP